MSKVRTLVHRDAVLDRSGKKNEANLRAKRANFYLETACILLNDTNDKTTSNIRLVY